MKRNLLKARRGKAGSRVSRRLLLESLEERRLLTTITHPIVYQPITASTIDPTPAQMQGAYGVNNIKVGSIVGTGAGQTIAIIDVGNENSISTQAAVYSDLQGFDAYYGLPNPPSFQVLNENGGTSLPAYNSGWSGEEALDMEWAHVMAPQANIILFETSGSLYTAVNTARNWPGVSVVSMSWGISPESTSQDPDFTTPSGHQGVTFLAATGDAGGESSYPANSPNVIAVGGTTLNTNGNNWSSETAWSGSGGGEDTIESEPSYQLGVQNTGFRETPDVSSDANPGTGVSIFVNGAMSSGYLTGGTSLSTPCWAGVIAIADQLRVSLGATTLDGATQTLPMLYSLPESIDFHDITSGSNNINSAGPGYDLVTGLGSPIGNLLVPALAPIPELTTAMSDSGSFPWGGTGTFSIVVSNTGETATSGTVTVRDTLPTGLTPTAADSGTVNGWTLSTIGQTVTATRSDALAAGASYSGLTVAVKVAANAPASITNTATASGGGQLNTAFDAASDTIGTFALPIVAMVGPSSGALSGGTFVTITGSNLLGASSVRFGTVPGTIILNTGNQILAESPVGTAGAADITVIKNNASSATSTADLFTYLAPPAVSAVSTTAAANSVFTVGGIVPITVTFNEPVFVSPGAPGPQLTLNDGGVANYASGSGSATLTFSYTVAAGQSSSDLDYSSTNSLALGSGNIQDAANDAASLTLPLTGTDELALRGIVIIPATAPLTAPASLTVPASDWAPTGLTLALGSDGNLHVYATGGTTDVVPPRPAAGVSDIEITAPIGASGSLTIDSSGGNPIPAGGLNYSGPAGLIKTSAGNAILSGTNTYAGGTAVSSGALIVTTASALLDGSNLSVGADAATVFGGAITAAGSPAAIASPAAAITPSPAAAVGPSSSARISPSSVANRIAISPNSLSVSSALPMIAVAAHDAALKSAVVQRTPEVTEIAWYLDALAAHNKQWSGDSRFKASYVDQLVAVGGL